MAIDKVSKLVVIGLADDFSKISKTLQRSSLMHIDKVEPMEGTANGLGGEQLSQADDNLARIESALAFLRKYNGKKRGLLEAKPEVGESMLTGGLEDALEICSQSEQCEEELAKLRTRETQLTNLQAQIMPYLSLDARVDQLTGNGAVRYYLGSVAADKVASFREGVLGLGAIEKGLGGAGENAEEHCFFLAIHRDDAEQLEAVLRDNDFNQANLPIKGVPREEEQAIREELDELRAERVKLEEQANAIGEQLPRLEIAFDQAVVAKGRYSLIEEAVVTEKAFVLTGWVRDRNRDRLERLLKHACPDLIIEPIEPEEGEVPPTALRNKGIIKTFEAVTDMYSTPQYDEIDPNPIMTPFFFCFFGMMVSDAGYGILLTIGAYFFMKKRKDTGMMGQVTGIVMFGGISTIIWGALYGGWFGIEDFVLKPIWFAPLDEPLKMIILCVVIGMIQISTGLLMNGYAMIKKGDVLGAIFDVGFVLMIIVGGPLAFVLPELGFLKYVALIGVVGMFLTAGRANKSIISKFTGGFSALYGLTGYLSDALSYTRLFGMGMATGVIAMVFNTIAGMLFGNIIGIPFGIAILIIGHVFNIGINALGAYVHSCRLQYIEFYSKFFEGGGRAFRPFGYQTKYARIKSEA